MGTKNATVKIDLLMMLMAQQIAIEIRSCDDGLGDELFVSIVEGIEEENNVTLYAFAEALTNSGYTAGEAKKGAAKIIRALKSKGWFAGEWDEGSFYLALTGFGLCQ